jgi:hypothetical protein
MTAKKKRLPDIAQVTSLEDFLSGQTPTLVLDMLLEVIKQLETQNDMFSIENYKLMQVVNEMLTRMEDMEDEISRLKKERITDRPDPDSPPTSGGRKVARDKWEGVKREPSWQQARRAARLPSGFKMT